MRLIRNPIKEKLYSYLLNSYIIIVILANLGSNKISLFYKFQLDAGYIFFPLTYFINDLVTEFYGYKKAKEMIIQGFIFTLIFLFAWQLIILLPAADIWPYQQTLAQIFYLSPRIFIGSAIAYLLGELLNARILTTLKQKMDNKHMYFRFILSTAIAAFFENISFYFIAFYGVYPLKIIGEMIFIQYILKIFIEAIIAPLAIFIRRYIK